jgi:molybdate transport system permease protein
VTVAARGRPPRRHPTTGLPGVLVPLAVVAVLFLVVPIIGLLVRAPWGTIVEVLAREESLQALRLSLVCATLATVVCLVLGVPLAWVLARGDFPGRSLLRALVVVPLVLPPVVGGVALFTALGRNGIVGRWLDEAFGYQLPFTTAAVVVAEAFVSLPFLVIAVEGALRGADQR